jgi:hypothetical protein
VGSAMRRGNAKLTQRVTGCVVITNVLSGSLENGQRCPPIWTKQKSKRQWFGLNQPMSKEFYREAL